MTASLPVGGSLSDTPSILERSSSGPDRRVGRQSGPRTSYRGRILEQYFKPYPVCRWAHPAIDAALELRRTGPVEVVAVEVVTFHEAVQRTWRRPVPTEQAQYSLPFPVAVALLRGGLTAADNSRDAVTDEAVLRLGGR